MADPADFCYRGLARCARERKGFKGKLVPLPDRGSTVESEKPDDRLTPPWKEAVPAQPHSEGMKYEVLKFMLFDRC